MDAGVECGIARADARENRYSEPDRYRASCWRALISHPFQITDEMNTPGGIGIAGYHTFVSAGLNGIVMDAVQAAFKRTTELGK